MSVPSSSRARARSARGSACPVQRTHPELGHPTLHLAPGHRPVTGLGRAPVPSLQRRASGIHSLCLLPLSRAPQRPGFRAPRARSLDHLDSQHTASVCTVANARPCRSQRARPRTLAPARAARFAPSTAPHPSLIACTQALRVSTHLDGTPLALRAVAGCEPSTRSDRWPSLRVVQVSPPGLPAPSEAPAGSRACGCAKAGQRGAQGRERPGGRRHTRPQGRGLASGPRTGEALHVESPRGVVPAYGPGGTVYRLRRRAFSRTPLRSGHPKVSAELLSSTQRDPEVLGELPGGGVLASLDARAEDHALHLRS